ncbi:MAG TPA: class I SAM-dependent methyltransferase [Acidimicrobiales bacterium]|jgi:SAM-dependent methyltransferase|nr:class I SAM-dependent methyltransferase [Acidimicrobiales bacterium]
MAEPSGDAPLSLRASLRWPLIRRAIETCAPATCLEIGCGQGAMGTRLARLTRSYLAVEPDQQSHEVAAARLGAVGGQVLHGSTELVPAGSRYDLVCAFEVLEHIDDDRAAVAEWVELVVPGGHLLVSVPAWPERFGPTDVAVGHFRRYRPDGLAEVLRSAGLEPVSSALYGWPLGNLLEATQNRMFRGTEPEPEETAARTARSGRLHQPRSRVRATLTGLAVRPFIGLQRLAPSRGTGIVALARRLD